MTDRPDDKHDGGSGVDSRHTRMMSDGDAARKRKTDGGGAREKREKIVNCGDDGNDSLLGKKLARRSQCSHTHKFIPRWRENRT